MSGCQEYLSVQIGRGANQQRAAASKLYSKTNILLKQNKELHKCSEVVKNMVINAYGSVYAVENFLCVDSHVEAGTLIPHEIGTHQLAGTC